MNTEAPALTIADHAAETAAYERREARKSGVEMTAALAAWWAKAEPVFAAAEAEGRARAEAHTPDRRRVAAANRAAA